jgi:hypothetical protein
MSAWSATTTTGELYRQLRRPGNTSSSGRAPAGSWRPIACRTCSHIGTTRTLGRALGLGLEAAAEPAGLVADLDDLDAPQLRVDAAAAKPEQLAAA